MEGKVRPLRDKAAPNLHTKTTKQNRKPTGTLRYQKLAHQPLQSKRLGQLAHQYMQQETRQTRSIYNRIQDRTRNKRKATHTQHARTHQMQRRTLRRPADLRTAGSAQSSIFFSNAFPSTLTCNTLKVNFAPTLSHCWNIHLPALGHKDPETALQYIL
jgi:hypothetical protein